MSDNPERDVIDAIDALVDEQLAQEASGYDHNLNQPKCELCRGEWHGIANAYGCPGANATAEEVAAFKAAMDRNSEEYWRQRGEATLGWPRWQVTVGSAAIAAQFDRTVLFGETPQIPRDEPTPVPVSVRQAFVEALRARLADSGWEISGDDPFDPTHWLVGATVAARTWLPGEMQALDDVRPIHWYAANDEETP